MQVICLSHLCPISDFFAPGSGLVFVLALLVNHISANFWGRLASLLCAIVAARLSCSVVSPLAAILLKWLVIGRYRAGQYRM
jgi:hypothetical protein